MIPLFRGSPRDKLHSRPSSEADRASRFSRCNLTDLTPLAGPQRCLPPVETPVGTPVREQWPRKPTAEMPVTGEVVIAVSSHRITHVHKWRTAPRVTQSDARYRKCVDGPAKDWSGQGL